MSSFATSLVRPCSFVAAKVLLAPASSRRREHSWLATDDLPFVARHEPTATPVGRGVGRGLSMRWVEVRRRSNRGPGFDVDLDVPVDVHIGTGSDPDTT